jgi:hypothetical protein
MGLAWGVFVEVGAIVLVGAIPLLPLLVRPLVTHRRRIVRGLAELLAMGLFWIGFNWSCFAIWGATASVELDFWYAIALVALLQIPAAWASHRVVFGDSNPDT